jgi:hypothetical protein
MADDLTLGALDGHRVPLVEVQLALSELITGIFSLLSEKQMREEDAERKIAPLLDEFLVFARPALPGERVHSGRDARSAARALVLSVSAGWEERLT